MLHFIWSITSFRFALLQEKLFNIICVLQSNHSTYASYLRGTRSECRPRSWLSGQNFQFSSVPLYKCLDYTIHQIIGLDQHSLLLKAFSLWP
jgi:hypothetical protein